MIRCLNEISEQLRRTLGLSLTNAQMESVLRGVPSSLSREYVDRLELHPMCLHNTDNHETAFTVSIDLSLIHI